MSSLQSVLWRVCDAVREPVDWAEIDEAIVELHNKLAEPKWAIEDEGLRHETEKLLVQMASKAYIKRHSAHTAEIKRLKGDKIDEH